MEAEIANKADLRPKLTPEQIARLEPFGAREALPRGAVLFDEGDFDIDFFVILSGQVDIRQYTPEGFRSIVKEGPGEFVGDTSTLSGRAAVVQAVADEDSEVLRIAPAKLRRVVVEDSELSDRILRTFLVRRSFLIESGHSAIKVIGSRYSPDTHRLRSFLTRNDLPFSFLDLEDDPAVAALLEQFGVGVEETPILMHRDRDIYRNPRVEDVAHCLGLDVIESDDVRDVLVVGSGPAGLAASVYAASEGLSVMAIDTDAPGGQAGTSSKIENYLGFPTGISGTELAARAAVQAQKFGTRMASPVRAERLSKDGANYRITFADGRSARGRAVVIATGARYRRLDVPGAEKYEGCGIYYGATAMESELCTGCDVVVVGGGNSAGQGAVYLAKGARNVHIVIRRDDLSETMSRYLIRRIDETPNIHLHPRSEITALSGEDCLKGVEISARGQAAPLRLEARHMFLFLGALPCTDWLQGAVVMDEKGFVKTGADLSPEELARAGWPGHRGPTLFETSLPRVYAVGDARSGSVKRVASAVGEGSIAVQFIHRALGEV